MPESKSFPKVSIVVATLNNAPVLKKTINGILRVDYPEEFEIIVVNDGSTDNTKEMLEKEFGKNKKVKIINLPRSGVCKARNAGIKATRFPILVNMDHDCIPSKSWLKNLVKGFDSEKVGVVSSFGYYGGTSTAFRKKLVEKVGGYDEEYFYYREDTDLSFKIMDLGYEFKVVKADYFHDHKMVKPKGLIPMLKHVLQRLEYHKNDVLLFKKHPKLAGKFLNVKFGFLVSPITDFQSVTNTWFKDGKIKLSSPRGITFIENKTLLHTIAIYLIAICYVLALKFFRLLGSIKYGKLLL